ncbi:MAG: glycosyltransferase [Clostridium sp.]
MITVLMATYQGRQYLEQQLDTILAQTVPVKILISDDGSDDGTREMLDNYAGWYPKQVVLHHRTEHTGGAAGNFFWLMQEALKDEKNEYILFSDQDDVWENDKVSVMLHRMKVLEKGLGSACLILLYSDMEVVDEELYEISPSFASYTHQDPDRSSFAELWWKIR